MTGPGIPDCLPSTRPPPSACAKPQPCSHIKVTIPIGSLRIAGPAMRLLRRLQTCAPCSRQAGSRRSKRFRVSEGELREALRNWHEPDGGPIWNGCAAQLSRTMSFALYRGSGRSRQTPARDAPRGDARATGSGFAREERKRCRGNRSATTGNPARRAGANAGAHPRRPHGTRRRAPSRHAARHQP